MGGCRGPPPPPSHSPPPPHSPAPSQYLSKLVLIIVFSLLVVNKAILLHLLLKYKELLGLGAERSLVGGLLDTDVSASGKPPRPSSCIE